MKAFKSLLLFIPLFFLLSGCTPEEKPLYVTYDTFDDIEHLLSTQSDSTYVVNFWATWCQPCIEELPFFEQLNDEFGKEKLKVILVSLDFEKDIEPRLIPFLEEHQLQSDVALLLDGKYNNWIDKVEPSWDGAIPVTMIFNGQGKLFHGKQYANYEQLSNMVKEML